MQVDPLAQIGDILRGFIGNAGYVILIDKHGGGARINHDFLDVNHGAVGDAPHGVQPSAAFEFDVVRISGLAPQQGIGGKGDAGGPQRQGIESKRNHCQAEPTPFESG